MSPVLEATSIKGSLTGSSNYNGWLSFLDEKAPIITEKWFKLPELSTYLVERTNGNWSVVNEGTVGNQNIIEQVDSNIVDYIESPLMPPKNQFEVNLIIERIEKGIPSLCDEVGF